MSDPADPAKPPRVEPPSPDIDLAADASSLPGAHRGGFSRLPTAPLDVTTEWASSEPGTASYEPVTTEWLMPSRPASRGLAGWALGIAIMGLIGSLVVGWAFPIGLAGIVPAIIALRNPVESRGVAIWALVLGTVSILYSAGWLWWVAGQTHLFG